MRCIHSLYARVYFGLLAAHNQYLATIIEWSPFGTRTLQDIASGWFEVSSQTEFVTHVSAKTIGISDLHLGISCADLSDRDVCSLDLSSSGLVNKRSYSQLFLMTHLRELILPHPLPTDDAQVMLCPLL